MGDQQRKAVNGGEENNSDDIDRLELMSTIGFNGKSLPVVSAPRRDPSLDA